MRTDKQILDECNALAREFYRHHGCVVPDGFEFRHANHPIAVRCWEMAMAAYEHIEGTDMQNCFAGIEEEQR